MKERGQKIQPAETADDPLIIAVQTHDHEKLAILLKARSNVNARDGSGMTPAMYAAKALNFWALRMLEQAGADLSASARDRSTAMSWATEWEAMTVLQAEEQIRIIQLLQSQGLRHPRNPGLPDIVVSINMAITGQKADRMPAERRRCSGRPRPVGAAKWKPCWLPAWM